uniref:Uncharacterized protein n=1 Tax=Citrifermentans bremense TaxID=60035 RepID=A0A6S6LZU4_9BACT
MGWGVGDLVKEPQIRPAQDNHAPHIPRRLHERQGRFKRVLTYDGETDEIDMLILDNPPQALQFNIGPILDEVQTGHYAALLQDRAQLCRPQVIPSPWNVAPQIARTIWGAINQKDFMATTKRTGGNVNLCKVQIVTLCEFVVKGCRTFRANQTTARKQGRYLCGCCGGGLSP